MSIVVGTQPGNVNQIMSDMAANLKLPGGVKPGEAIAVQPSAPVDAKPSNGNGAPPAAAAPAEAPKPAPVIPNVSSAAATAQNTKPLVELPDFLGDEPPAEAPPVTELPKTEVPAGVEVDDADLPTEASAVNFKKLRDSRIEERKAKKALEEEHRVAKEKLERYERGEAMPEVLQAKDQRIQELEKYEVVVNGQLSREYQELVVQPIQEKKGRLEQLAKDYNVPETSIEPLIKKIVETDNVKERNAIISKYFPDQAGIIEVKGLVEEMHNLGETALQMEQKPHETRQSLIAQYKAKQDLEREERATAFETISKSAWHNALDKTAKEGIYRELIVQPDDPEFTKTVVEPLQQKAALQYGALVKELSKNGLKTLPQKLADGIARMIILSIGGANVFNAKEAAVQAAETLKHNTSNLATYMRPSIGRPNGSPTKPPTSQEAKGPKSPAEAGKLAAQNIPKK